MATVNAIMLLPYVKGTRVSSGLDKPLTKALANLALLELHGRKSQASFAASGAKRGVSNETFSIAASTSAWRSTDTTKPAPASAITFIEASSPGPKPRIVLPHARYWASFVETDKRVKLDSAASNDSTCKRTSLSSSAPSHPRPASPRGSPAGP